MDVCNVLGGAQFDKTQRHLRLSGDLLALVRAVLGFPYYGQGVGVSERKIEDDAFGVDHKPFDSPGRILFEIYPGDRFAFLDGYRHLVRQTFRYFYIAEKRIFPEGFLTSLVEIYFRDIASVRKIEQRAHVGFGEMGRRFDFDLGRLIGHDRLRIAYADPIVVYFHCKVAGECADGETQKNQNARLEQPAVYG